MALLLYNVLGAFADIQLRTLLANQTRYIVLKHLFERKQNPLVILTPNLDITLPYNGAPAILTKEQFNALVGGAIHEAQRIKSLLIPNPEIKEILAMSQEERNAKMAAVSCHFDVSTGMSTAALHPV